MPEKFGLPSIRAGGRTICGAWAKAGEVTASTAITSMTATATATVINKPTLRSRICFLLHSLSLQRIVFDPDEIGGVVLGRGMRPPAFREGEVLRACAAHQPGQAVVP